MSIDAYGPIEMKSFNLFNANCLIELAILSSLISISRVKISRVNNWFDHHGNGPVFIITIIGAVRPVPAVVSVWRLATSRWPPKLFCHNSNGVYTRTWLRVAVVVLSYLYCSFSHLFVCCCWWCCCIYTMVCGRHIKFSWICKQYNE